MLSGSRPARIAARAMNRLSSLAVITAMRRHRHLREETSGTPCAAEKQFKAVWERSALLG
jgi:hypothetical protein